MVDIVKQEGMVYGGAAGLALRGDFKDAFQRCMRSMQNLMDGNEWTPVRVLDIKVVPEGIIAEKHPGWRQETTEIHIDMEFKEGKTEQPFKEWFLTR
jgi:hypothetical protein